MTLTATQLLQPILGSLKDTEREWIVHVVNAFNDGDIRRYNELQQQYKEQLNGQVRGDWQLCGLVGLTVPQSVLLSHVQELKEKISVLCLMELVFKRPSEERTIPFAVIADVTQLPLNDVRVLSPTCHCLPCECVDSRDLIAAQGGAAADENAGIEAGQGHDRSGQPGGVVHMGAAACAETGADCYAAGSHRALAREDALAPGRCGDSDEGLVPAIGKWIACEASLRGRRDRDNGWGSAAERVGRGLFVEAS